MSLGAFFFMLTCVRDEEAAIRVNAAGFRSAAPTVGVAADGVVK